MFDPYHKWLGIPKVEQPPTFYRLLGINPAEQDPEVIEEAAIRQSTFLRAYQAGPHAAECSRLLNEIAQARATLLDPAKRKVYDARLVKAAQPAPPAVRVARPVADPFDLDPVPATRPPAPKKRSVAPALLIGGAAAALVALTALAGTLVWFLADDGSPAEKKVAAAVNKKPTDPPAKESGPAKPDEPPLPTGTKAEVTTKPPGPKQGVVKLTPLTEAKKPEVKTPSKVPEVQPPPKKAPKRKAPKKAAPAALPDAPDAEAQAKSAQKVRTAFQADYAKTSLADKRSLAGRLRQEAEIVKDNPADRFVLLREASDLAAQGGDLLLAFQAVDEMTEQYDFDSLKLLADALEKASRVMKSREASTILVSRALLVSDAALEAEAFDEGKKALKIAEAALPATGNAQLRAAVAEAKEKLQRATEAAPAARQARERLATDPGDAKANGELGRYLIFQRGEWEEGLSHLERGDDPELAKLAARDRQGTDDPKEQLAIGDAWWRLAEQAGEDDRKEALRHRARSWHARAMPRLDAPQRARYEDRLKYKIGSNDVYAGLVGEYFAGGHRRLRRVDYAIDFTWDKSPPHPNVPMEQFRAAWVGWLKVPKPGKYVFDFVVDDGFRLSIDGQVVQDQYRADARNQFRHQFPVYLPNTLHLVKLDFVQGAAGAQIHWRWRRHDEAELQLVPPEAFFHDATQHQILTNDYTPFRGQWVASYTNKARHEYTIDDLGNVTERTRPKQKGHLEKRNGDTVIEYSNGSFERFRLVKGQLVIDHYNPPSQYPNQPPVLRAVGVRVK